ncbi:hypothetical protein [Actinoplanes sp. CA-252034]|uniref:hypothetical protein n=1 Tax=Actinoplanes sp. CA-252034 TaxID=3239906 RepID=UPI003D9817EA
MPRNRLILRQVLLSLAAMFVCLSAWVTVGVLTGPGSTALTITAVPAMLLGLIAPVLLWFAGEDPLDRRPVWFTGISVVTLLFAIAASAGVASAYLDVAGRRVPVVVTAGDDTAHEGYQLVVARTTADGEDLGEVLVFADRDVRAGDRMVALIDPLGWFPPNAGQPSPQLLRYTYGLAAAGSMLLAVLTTLRIRRDLRRYDFTGSRRPAERLRRDRPPTVGLPVRNPPQHP